MHISTRTLLLAALPAALLLGPACGKETGIPQRHLHGVVTLPPVGLFEIEPDQRAEPVNDETNELNNDSIATADGPFSITTGYHTIRGHIDSTCDELDPADPAGTLDCAGPPPFPAGPPADDQDFFRIRAGYRGPIVFYAEVADGDAGDADMIVYDGQGVELYTQDQNNQPGPTEVDDEGNEIQTLAVERYATEVEPGDEFFVRVTVNSPDDEADYELTIVGNDPRRHDVNFGTEGDTSGFVSDLGETIWVDAFEVKVGAFLSNDIENLGAPVGGTSCDAWQLDADTRTFWCAWEMHFLQQVTIESDVLIPGMDDGKDNDCDGVADTGTEEVDNDGDGYRISQGDCNDADPDVHPFRGDTAGDRKDNDCDGWADNGPDDVDDDGDGYCENGTDVNGDGVCRGRVETQSFGSGDCNDTDPTINPGLQAEIEGNHIDDNCADGDRVLSSLNSDGDSGVIEGTTPHDWSDLEETACGTNPFDPDDRPADLDGDGLCDSTCIGTVDCAQDWDGDGFHNWTEIQCNGDPESADTALPDMDEDGVCDGRDNDADGDGFVRLTSGGGTDCHDLDPMIRPHAVDETGAPTDFWYDVPNGIDDDCDGIVDENRDWTRTEAGEFTQNTSFLDEDQDGDGYSLNLRDCDDTDATMQLGNYEVRSTNVVTTDFNTVYLFAGDVADLNNTGVRADARRTTELVPFDLEKDRVAWAFDTAFEDGQLPLLEPEGLPVLPAWYVKQPEIGKLWFEAEPNDIEIAGFSPVGGPPFEDGVCQEVGEAAGAGKTNEYKGEIESIVVNSWDGDNDCFHVTFPEAGFVTTSLNWSTGGGDYDELHYCWYFDSVNPPNYYGVTSGLTDLTKPEEADTVVPLPDGSDCFYITIGYSGSAGPYTVSITPQGN